MSIFKKGDKVYHAKHGKGVVNGPEYRGHHRVGMICSVDFESQRGYELCFVEGLSFSPWPEANHVRPFEPVLKKGDVIVLVSNSGGAPFTVKVAQEFKDAIHTGEQSSWPKSQFTAYYVGPEINFN